MERIGLIGLGRMGVAMGGRLLAAGFTLTVWNRTKSKAEELLAQGAVWGESPQSLADRADVVLTTLTDDAAVREVYSGANGLLTGDASGKLFVEMSTIRTATIVELARQVAQAGAALVDAPVSGTVGPAREGKLLALAGGAPADVERAMPILNVLTRRVAHLGPSGSGTTMKLVLNLPMAIYWQGLAEALAIGNQFGLDLRTMLDLIIDSPASLAALPAKSQIMLGAEAEVGFDITGVRKDLLAMIATGQELGVPMPAASASLVSFMAATAAGRGGDDLATLIPHYIAAVEQTAGISAGRMKDDG